MCVHSCCKTTLSASEASISPESWKDSKFASVDCLVEFPWAIVRSDGRLRVWAFGETFTNYSLMQCRTQEHAKSLCEDGERPMRISTFLLMSRIVKPLIYVAIVCAIIAAI